MTDTTWRVIQTRFIELLPAFLLTTLAGTALTSWYQRFSAKQQNEAMQLAADRTAATAILDETSRGLTRRLRLAQDLVAELPSTGVRLRERQPKVRDDSVWSDNSNRLRALTCRYFGYAALQKLELIDVDLLRLRLLTEELIDEASGKRKNLAKLQALHIGSIGDLPSAVGRLGDSLHVRIYRLTLEMADQVRAPRLSGPADPNCARQSAFELELARGPLYWSEAFKGIASQSKQSTTR